MSEARLTKQVFVDGMDKLRLGFMNWNFDVENVKQVKVWYEMLQDILDWVFEGAITQYIKNNKNYPTIASIREECWNYYTENRQNHE